MTVNEAFRKLLKAAERFEAKTPQYRRIEQERQALREAIFNAQLILSTEPPFRKSSQDKPKASAEEITEAAVLLRSLPGGKKMSPEQRRAMQQRKSKARQKP
jgi:hypothetical protein